MAATNELPRIDEANYVDWVVTDSNLVVPGHWVRPTRLDVAKVRGPWIVPALEAVSQDARAVTEEEVASGGLNVVIERMTQSTGENGAGIHAVQVGGARDIAGIRFAKRGLTVLAQPRFVPSGSHDGNPTNIDVEGCLSLPGAVIAHPYRHAAGNIEADFEITYKLNRRGKVVSAGTKPWDPSPVNDDVDGIKARIAQHEEDHPAGILFPDRAYVDADRASRRLLTGNVFWVHGEHYRAYLEQLDKIRRVQSGEMRERDLPELPLPALPQDQYRALRMGRIVMPKPSDLG